MDNLRGIQLTEEETETLLHCIYESGRWAGNSQYHDKAEAMRLRLETLYPRAAKRVPKGDNRAV